MVGCLLLEKEVYYYTPFPPRAHLTHLDGLVLKAEPVERLDGLVGVVGQLVVDEAVAEALPGDLVPDELAALHLADGGEERADLLLRHGLRQVVDDQVRLRLVVVGLLVFWEVQWDCYTIGCIVRIRIFRFEMLLIEDMRKEYEEGLTF